MKIKSSLKTIAFLYDFAVDGGAVGTIPMGIFIPFEAQIFGWASVPVTNLVSNTTTNIEIQATNTIVSQDSASFNVPDGDVNSLAALSFPVEVSLIISNDFLTAGKFKFLIYYNEYE